MAFVDNTIEVEADVREAFSIWTAYETFPKFMEVVQRIDVIPDGPLHWVAVADDDLIEWDADVVEHEWDQSVSWKAVDGRETGKVTFERLGADCTKVHYQLEYDPMAWGAEPGLVGRWMKQRVEKDLEAFRSFVEKK